MSKVRTVITHLVFLLLFVGAHSQGCGQTSNGERNQPCGTKRACGGDIDIRNNVQNFNKLVNCTVIEGSLHILLIDFAKPEDYMPYTFPDLIEITDHLLLYRVFGLKSLRTIFPNLAVIRGQNLFLDYALIAYEMPDLTDLGLVSLTSIPRGAVRLEKNTNLCFIETIDWEKIVKGVQFDDNYFQGNKDIKECVNRCPDKCDSTMSDMGPKKRCWTITDCQKMLDCPVGCESGFCDGQTCCDTNCIGGCSGPYAKECLACKDVIQYDNGMPICASRCSPGTYKFKNRRCLLSTECLNFTDYRPPKYKLVLPMTSTESGECVSECPAGYKESSKIPKHCEKCEKCAKTCIGKVVDSVSSAQELKHCTIIAGPLEISLRGGERVMHELEESLAQIEEVTNFIRIYDSFDLISLHFFKNLRLIGGEKLYKNRWSFVAFENLNLQELFLDNVTSTLKFGNGTVSFQANRKLCYNKIMDLVNATGLTNKTTDDDVAVDTNGDQVPCNVKKLQFVVMKTAPHLALFRWSVFNTTDERHLISYTLSYKETEEKNISIYKGRDACSDSEWKSNEFMPTKDNEYMFNYIHGLKPWTQYAAYISTLTISKADKGAVSDVIYFRTAAEVSTSPTNLQVLALVPGELHVSWMPPDKPNGNISHYEVYWQKRDLDPAEYELRDYCTDPLSTGLTDKQKEEEEMEHNATMNGQCCACPMSEKQRKKEKLERDMEIKFQDFLQNEVYLKRLERPASTIKPTSNLTKAKLKQAIDPTVEDPHEVNKYTYVPKSNSNPVVLPTGNPNVSSTEAPADKANGSTTMSIEDINEKRQKENPYFKAEVYKMLEWDIPDLGHFEDYNIEVIACQERDPRDPDKHAMLCSHRALGLGRTQPNATADTINSSTIHIQLVQNKTGTVLIKWSDPPAPNGLILTYDLKYKKSNVQNVKPLLICITYKMYIAQNRGHFLDKLEPGNYTLQLRATSIAGNGSWTEELSFKIPEPPSADWSNHLIIVVVVVIVIVLLVFVILAVWFIAKKRFRQPDNGIWSPNPDYSPEYLGYEPDEWEVDRDNVQLIKELGQGSFGMVYEGIVRNITLGDEDMLLISSVDDGFRVAVKTTNNNSTDFDRYQFLQEASIMKAFKCHHVVKLIGVVSKGQPALVLMELMPNGDLKNFLRMHRPDEEDNDGRAPPTLRQILQMAGEIADGMAYLADKKYVHRDLAARNCMVAENMTVKIGDFGMTRDIYETDYYRKGNRGLLPVRWMAPESLKDGVFTSMSDVWSYGVVLWEMATLAAQPYQGLSNEEVLRYATSGKIMDMPERCPSKLYDLMVKCWRYRQKQRPTFKEIIEILLPDLDKNFKEVSYFFSEENAKYEESQKAAENNSHNDVLENVDDDEEDTHCPINDYVDEANLPMLGAGASNGHSVELEDIFSDNGTYPHYSGSHKHVGSSEICDCPSFRAVDEGAAAQSVDFNRQSVCSSPNSAIGGSSDGSKDSSKSSSSSYAHMNGLSVANGHVPMHVRAAPCYQ